MDLRAGILSTAKALGIDPLDLATAISYETAGTFDPTKAGPTTQWGQHRGLIQFGEPQAKKYGVDWANPTKSQLGPKGAIASYLRDTGVKPGMGLLDIYSAINAGGVGRYGRSDANNGGAPGTVRDKVEKQMAGHRKKAAALLGGDTLTGSQGADPIVSTQGGAAPPLSLLETPDMPEERKLLGGLLSEDKRDRLILALEGMTMNPNQGLMMAASQGIKGRAEGRKEAKEAEKEAKRKQAVAKYFAETLGRPDLAQAYVTGAASSGDLYKMATAPKDQTKGVNIDGKLVNPITGELIADYSGGTGSGLDKDALSAANTLRDDLRTDLGQYDLVRSGYQNVRTFYDNPGSVSDYALAVGFAKILDPGSVAREGEVSAVANSGSLSDALRTQVVNALKGTGSLPQAVREDIARLSTELYQTRAGEARTTLEKYESLAGRAGLTIDDIYSGSGIMKPSPLPSQTAPATQSGAAPAPNPGSANPQAQPQMFTKEQIGAAVSALSPYDKQLMESIPSPQGKIDFLKQRGLLK